MSTFLDNIQCNDSLGNVRNAASWSFFTFATAVLKTSWSQNGKEAITGYFLRITMNSDGTRQIEVPLASSMSTIVPVSESDDEKVVITFASEPVKFQTRDSRNLIIKEIEGQCFIVRYRYSETTGYSVRAWAY